MHHRHLDAERVNEIRRRQRALASGMQARDLDALVTAREANVTYLTGYTTQTWSNFSRPVIAVLFADESLALICAETEADAVRDCVPAADVRDYVRLLPVEPGDRLPDGRVQFGSEAGRALSGLLRDRAVARVGVDGLHAVWPPAAQVMAWAPDLERRAADASDLFWQHRLHKSEWEIQRLQAACDVLDRAFAAIKSRLRRGQTEREIHRLLASAAFDAGADALGYTNVVAGTGRGLFGAPTDRPWNPGEVLYVDGGVIVDGYWADFCRMYTWGEAREQQAAGYERAYSALRQATERFADCATAGDLCRLISEAAGLAPGDVGFGRFGHGIGLYMPEPPSLHVDDETPLDDGLVLCIEPAVVHRGANYVVEEEYVVRGQSITRLSPPAPPGLVVPG